MKVTGKKAAAKGRAGEAVQPQLTLVASVPAPLPAGVPQYLTVDEVAAMLRCKTRTIYQMVSERRIPFRKAGKLLLFDSDEIDRWTQESALK
jgi:excisionase family DNA binding protein